jgi:hypothetical protein
MLLASIILVLWTYLKIGKKHIIINERGTKLYIPSAIKTQIDLVTYCFWAGRVVLGITKLAAILLKYPILVASTLKS